MNWEAPLTQVQVHESALKRGLGVDDAGRPWEVGALSFANGARYLVIHAMPARKSVVERMQRRMR